ncbi:hypothetical protein [Aliarcobacter skirrowii]|uniref:DUF4365 domain-containing protein n=1 Tax=Aliarcobacter skirrowii TaxID=28200 RepID=A0AAW9DC01_9BACT|nr:hypothetical protein [Aliarcobacter skirrowii]MDX4069852.1 hypothetical protein [Aliarcobacter skirrowii]
MPNKITNIQYNKGKKQDRVYVYIDNKYCASIRARTWEAFKLNIGDEISCEELKKQESFMWKNLYQNSWEEEKIRLEYVKAWLKKYISLIEVKITGFGADSNEIIEGHPEKKGEPDMTLFLKDTKTIVLFLEVTGTKYKRGNDYWVRPDKIDYIQQHKDKDIWIALHYEDDKKIIWLKPSLSKEYNYVEKNLKGAIEHYVVFNDESKEVKSSQFFKEYVENKIRNV